MGNTSCGCECPPRQMTYRDNFNQQNQINKLNKNQINHHHSSQQHSNQNKKQIQSISQFDKQKHNQFQQNLSQPNEELDNSFLPLESQIKTNKDKNVIYQQDQTKIQQTNLSFNKQDFNVPFSVIKLIIPQQIKKQLKNFQQNYEKDYDSLLSGTINCWKLQPQGFYSNRKDDGTVILITNSSYYKGSTKADSCIPDQKGILITKKGDFQGNFLDGKAQGKGLFASIDEQTKFSGDWQKGRLIKGKAIGHDYLYDGSFRNGQPHGYGSLIQYAQNQKQLFRYNGNFQNGKFDGMGRYQCQKYVYTGKFKAGKKHGTGSLILIQRKLNYEPHQQKFQGEWQNDKLRPKISTS